MHDRDRMCALLAAQEPSWEPGTGHGESALFFGHLIGEVVRRVDGRSPGRFLTEEVCGPLELDFHVGLGAAERARAVDLTGREGLPPARSPRLSAGGRWTSRFPNRHTRTWPTPSSGGSLAASTNDGEAGQDRPGQ